MKEKIEALFASDQNITQAMAADILGVSRQRINQICKKHGIKLASGVHSPRSQVYVRRFPPKPPHWAGKIWRDLNVTIKAAIGELLVASDLMSKGFYVYRCVSQTGPCDIIAHGKSGLLRIEVRCGNIGSDGRLCFTPPQEGRYDILAVVSSDKSIHYKPMLPSAYGPNGDDGNS